MLGVTGLGITGAFGKIPAAGDFVSIGEGSAVTQALQGWLQQENDHVASKRLNLPQRPIRFVYRDHAGGTVIGAFGPSRDQVGRLFPLSIYTHVDVHTAMPRFSALPTAFDGFLDQACQIIESSETMSVEDLAQRVAGLPLPGAAELRDAALWTHDALGATPGGVLLERLFGPLEQGVHYHGLNMMRTACKQVHGRDPGKAGIIVECHAGDDVQVAFWLCMAETLLGWTAAPPAFFWTDVSSDDSRMLLSLGAPPMGLLHYFADRSVVADRLWPTRTTSAAAIDAGRKALGGPQRQALEPPAPTAAGLLAALVQP